MIRQGVLTSEHQNYKSKILTARIINKKFRKEERKKERKKDGNKDWNKERQREKYRKKEKRKKKERKKTELPVTFFWTSSVSILDIFLGIMKGLYIS